LLLAAMAGLALLSVSTAHGQEDWQAQWARGTQALQSRDYATAVSVFEQITKDHPDKYASAYYMLGMAQRGQGQTSQALANLRKAVSLEGAQESWKIVLGQTLIQAKQYQEAFTTLSGINRSGLKAEERSSHALLLANAANRANQPQQAISALENQIRADANNASLHAALGVAYDAMGDEQKAYASFKKAYQLNPEDEKSGGEAVRLGKTLGRRASGDSSKRRYYSDAAQLAERLANAAPSLDHYLDAGEAWMGAKEYQKAVGWFDKAASKYPQNAHVYFYRGQCYSSLGRLDQSVAELQQALKIGPTGKLREQVYETLGYVYDKQKKYDDAERVYREIGNQTKVAEIQEKKKLQDQNLEAQKEKEQFIAQVTALRRQIEELEKLGQMDDVRMLREQLADLEKALRELQ
jgi:tetratricopeptide (TPR) repeat protein